MVLNVWNGLICFIGLKVLNGLKYFKWFKIIWMIKDVLNGLKCSKWC